MKLIKISILFVCFLVIFTSLAYTQSPVIKTRTFIVNLFITATKHGKYVTDLKKNDFEVFENGVKQEILYFRNLRTIKEIPLTMVILVDTSGSVSDKLSLEIKTASKFLEEILRPKKDIAAIIEFHSEVVLVQDFTDKVEKLEEGLNKLRPGGNTARYDAIYLASEEKLKGEAGRKIIIVLSDGEDTCSMVSEKEAIKAAQSADVLIYGLGVRTRGIKSNFGVLEKMCKSTGGRFFKVGVSFRELRETFKEIERDIRCQYNIAYKPKDIEFKGRFRKIKVKVKRRGIKLRYRNGYFEPEEM